MCYSDKINTNNQCNFINFFPSNIFHIANAHQREWGEKNVFFFKHLWNLCIGAANKNSNESEITGERVDGFSENVTIQNCACETELAIHIKSKETERDCELNPSGEFNWWFIYLFIYLFELEPRPGQKTALEIGQRKNEGGRTEWRWMNSSIKICCWWNSNLARRCNTK